MTGVLIAGVVLASNLLAQGSPPTNLQAEQATNPPAVTDNRPDFRAQNNLGATSDRFQLQVTTAADTLFGTPLWSSAAPNVGTPFPGNATVNNGAVSPEIGYGEGSNYVTLPLLDWTKSYNWRVKFGSNSVWNSAFSATGKFTMAAPTWAISQHNNNGSPTVDSWRFVSVPIAFGTTVPASELLGSVSSLYRLDEPGRTWVALGPGDLLEGGRGYLAWCSPTTVLTLSQGKVTAGIPPTLFFVWTTTPSYSFPNATFPTYAFSYTTLGAPVGQEVTDAQPANSYRGNHLFGNPFYAPLSWRESTLDLANFTLQPGDVSRTNISAMMYKWDGTQYLTYNGTTGVGSAGELIEPFQAVGIIVLDPNYTLNLNTPSPPLTGGPQKAQTASMASTPPPAPDPEHWYLMLEARSGPAIDTENAFGIDPKADDAWDFRDSEEPGAGTATWVLVYFDHSKDWTKYPRKYTHDFRKTPTKAGDEVVWTFTVDGNTTLPATLTWPNLSSIPASDWKFTLEDPANSATVDLSAASSYDTLPVNGPSTMTLRATRLRDTPPPAPASSSGGGSNCGLLGPEGLLLIGWLLARRSSKPRS